MSNKIIIFISIIVVVIIIGAGTTLWPQLISAPEKQILNFEDCVVGGNPIMETYPRQCRHGDQTFVENVSLSMSREEAVQIAGETQECTTVGIPTAEISYNEGTKTWWIDLVRTPELETDGCHPACVVSEETKTAIRSYLAQINAPAVIDAAAIHALSNDAEIIKGKGFLLTPHSHEFFILTGKEVYELEHKEKQKVAKQRMDKNCIGWRR